MTRPNELVFVPLGGVGEIGMNMAAYGFGPEQSRKWIVVDCGVTFGRPSQPGIELIMADPGLPRGQCRRRPGADPHAQPRGPLRRGARPLARLRQAGLRDPVHRGDARGQARLRPDPRQCRDHPDAAGPAVHRRPLHHRADQRRPLDPREQRAADHHRGRAVSSTPATGSSIRTPSPPRPPTPAASRRSDGKRGRRWP